MENHHILWVKPLLQWQFSMSLFVCLPEGIQDSLWWTIEIVDD
jgi:hypothetical protein